MNARVTAELGSDVKVWLLRSPVGSGDDRYVGGVLDHPQPDALSGRCGGAFYWDRDDSPWELVSLEPLTVGPRTGVHDGSIRCHCGCAGFIRAGRWVPA